MFLRWWKDWTMHFTFRSNITLCFVHWTKTAFALSWPMIDIFVFSAFSGRKLSDGTSADWLFISVTVCNQLTCIWIERVEGLLTKTAAEMNFGQCWLMCCNKIIRERNYFYTTGKIYSLIIVVYLFAHLLFKARHWELCIEWW